MRTTLILGWVFAGLLLVVLGLLAYLAIRPAAAVSPPVAAMAPNVPYSIVVDGNGEASAPPDIAYVTLGVDTPASTAAEASDNNARDMAAVIAAVKGQGIPNQDVRTQDFSVTPVYAIQKPGDTSVPTIAGYRVRNTVRVTVEDIENVGKVLDAGLLAHANSAVGVSFAIKDSATLQQQALKDAVRQAQSKADAMAASARLRLTGPYTIIESSIQAPQPLGGAQPAGLPAATPIESGQLTVSVHVQIVFQYAH